VTDSATLHGFESLRVFKWEYYWYRYWRINCMIKLLSYAFSRGCSKSLQELDIHVD